MKLIEHNRTYKQTEIGLIPSDWEVKTINEAFDVFNNLRLPISEDIRKTMQGIYPYYGPTKIQDYLNEYRVEGEYVLIGEDGDHFLKWQETPMTQITNGKFNVNNHAHLIKGRNKIALTKWFHYFFVNRNITEHLTRQGAGRYKLSKSTLLKINCVIPPTLTEQAAIITALSDTDALISSLSSLITKKRNIKQGAMQKLLQPKEGWEVKKLGEVCEIFGRIGFRGYTVNDIVEKEQGAITISPSNLQDDKMDFTKCTYISWFKYEESPEIKIFNGDILLVKTGSTSGKTAIIKKLNEKATINPQIVVLKKILVDNLFLSYIMSHKVVQDQIKTTIVGGAIPTLSQKQIANFKISLPKSKVEQTRIATILSDMDAEIASLEQQLEKYKDIKQGMMQNLLTGKIRLI